MAKKRRATATLPKRGIMPTAILKTTTTIAVVSAVVEGIVARIKAAAVEDVATAGTALPPATTTVAVGDLPPDEVIRMEEDLHPATITTIVAEVAGVGAVTITAGEGGATNVTTIGVTAGAMITGTDLREAGEDLPRDATIGIFTVVRVPLLEVGAEGVVWRRRIGAAQSLAGVTPVRPPARAATPRRVVRGRALGATPPAPTHGAGATRDRTPAATPALPQGIPATSNANAAAARGAAAAGEVDPAPALLPPPLWTKARRTSAPSSSLSWSCGPMSGIFRATSSARWAPRSATSFCCGTSAPAVTRDARTWSWGVWTSWMSLWGPRERFRTFSVFPFW
mmetsp:Transcript_23762/g.42746  ORF Transcript_23762/g.42746 Transcript_23762/m.42746 type:complete len:339 (+) Transcript_23762:404-1420(+)